jgi:2-phospho-L-lactate guanylyltransferase
MRAILVPVKEFRSSKERLSPYYNEEERARLARAMCEDTFRVVAQVRAIDRVYVVSTEYHALTLARQSNWNAINETQQISESQSVDEASRHCAGQGVRALLRLPIDIPLVTTDDIEGIFAALPAEPSAVVVPSRDGTGTNALLRSPPDLFPSHFGPESLTRHLGEAERAGATVRIVHNERIALDVDEPEDLRAVAGRVSPHSATARLIRQLGLRTTD